MYFSNIKFEKVLHCILLILRIIWHLVRLGNYFLL